MQQLWRVFVFSVVAATFPALAHTILAATGDNERLGDATLAEKPMEVLGGRLTVRMPQGSQSRARGHSIMAAPASEQQETRIAFDAGPERLVLMAEEVFAFGGDDFEKNVQEMLAKTGRKFKANLLPIPAKGLKAVVVTPVHDPDRSRSNDATFVEGIFVQSDDRTIQSLDVYVNRAAEKNLKDCRMLAHRILTSVAPGGKKLQLEAGERRLFAYSRDLEISIVVDKDTAVTTQKGPDFLVHRIVVLGQLGTDSDGIGVYVGNHPHFKPGAKKESGTVFGKKIDWYSPVGRGRGLETCCELPIPGNDHFQAHIWVFAGNDARLATMKQIAETMKLVKPKEPAAK
jgi:hypothetical protein